MLYVRTKNQNNFVLLVLIIFCCKMISNLTYIVDIAPYVIVVQATAGARCLLFYRF